MSEENTQKKNGGKRPGAGRKKGFVMPETKAKLDALAEYKKRVSKIAGKLLEAQAVEALGFHKMVRIERLKNGKVKELYTVTNPEEFDALLADGKLDEDYILVVAASPNYKASESILNRAFGRPKETVEHQGMDGEPLRIIIDI